MISHVVANHILVAGLQVCPLGKNLPSKPASNHRCEPFEFMQQNFDGADAQPTASKH